jgi:hypothetical protein
VNLWIPIAVTLLVAIFWSALTIVQRTLRRPVALCAPIALALAIVVEAGLLNLLSVAGAVTRTGVIVSHLALAIAAVVATRGDVASPLVQMPRRTLRAVRRLGIPGVLAVPIGILLAISAVRYAPNNWDSMTYHLARVAHWIQNQSVDVYPTNISRQITLGPGAEYLLLVAQVVADSDRLANFLQLACWVLITLAAPSLARLAGAPARIATWAAPLVASAPMVVLQATSTQNDLVSAVMGVAIVAAATPFLHAGRARWGWSDVAALAVAGAAAVLVKPLVVFALSPVVIAALAGAVRGAVAGPRRGERGLAFLTASAAFAALVAPDVLRRATGAPEGADDFAQFLYPLFGEWGDRFANIIRGAAHHLPVPTAWADALGMDARRLCGGSSLCTPIVLNAHEDYAGNPLTALAVVALVAVAALGWRTLRGLPRASVLVLPACWIVFHLFVRENPWVSRLQTPLVVLAPLALGALAVRRPPYASRPSAAWFAPLVVVSVLAGANAARENMTRPPLERPWWSSPERSYYAAALPELADDHDYALAVASETGCRALGLHIGWDSYDYPLTWRAMKRDIEVRHVVGPDAWPCVIFSDRGVPPPAAGATWVATESPFVYVNPAALRASQQSMP